MLPDISSFELLLILATISHLCTVYHLKQVCCLCFLFAKTGKPVEPLSLCPCYLACASARPGSLGELLTHASRQPSTNGGVGNGNHLINVPVSILPKVGMRFFYLSQNTDGIKPQIGVYSTNVPNPLFYWCFLLSYAALSTPSLLLPGITFQISTYIQVLASGSTFNETLSNILTLQITF